jgi:Bacterial Ig-like domain
MRFANRPSEAERRVWQSVATVGWLTLAMTLGLWTGSAGSVAAEDRPLFLYVTTLGGWANSPGGEDGGEGPPLAVLQGDNVTITLTSEDPFEHGLFIDYNNNSLPDGGDFISEPVGPFETITFNFTALETGVFDYCDQFVLTNCGKWTTRESNQAPRATILAPEADASWSAGSPHDIVFEVSDPDGDAMTVVLSYSYNGGTAQGTIAGPIPAGPNPNRYSWTPPAFHGPDTVIHLVVEDPFGVSPVVDSPVFEVDGTAPTIVSTTPERGATSVDRGIDIVVKWSEAMHPASGAPDAFGVQVQGGPWIAGTRSWSADAEDMVFAPAEPLSEATTYVVHVNATARDSSDPGNAFEGPDTWIFTTSAVIDSNRPTILGIRVDPPLQVQDAPVNVTANVQDDVGVSRVDAAITGPSFDENVTMAYVSGTTWYVNRTFSEVGSYSVTVWALDLAGNVASQSIGFDISPSGNTGLVAPASVAATMSDGLVEVTWTPVSFPGLAGYHVYRRGEAETEFQRLTKDPVPPTDPPVYLDEPPTGRTYYYTVRAVNTTEVESPNGPLVAVTIPPYQPAPLFDPEPWALAFLTLGLILGVLYATSLWRRRLT